MIHLKRFIASVLFIAILIGLLLVASAVVVPRTKITDFGAKDLEANGILCEKDNTVDALFLGDSETYCAFSPMEIWEDTGYTSYVSGTSGQTLDYTYTLVQRTFKNQSPKIVFLETNTVFRVMDNYRVTKTWLGTTFSVFVSHDCWKDLSVKDLFTPHSKGASDDNKGFVFNTVKKPPARVKDFSIPNGDKKEIPQVNVDLIKQIKQYCDEQNVKFVFVSAPSTVNWSYQRHNAVAALADEIGCEYIDLNIGENAVDIDWSHDTRDGGDHMNYYGAKKTSKQMAKYLLSTGLLTDRRNSSAFASWNEAFTRYNAMLKKNGVK